MRADIFKVKGLSLLSKLMLAYIITARYCNVRDAKDDFVTVNIAYTASFFGVSESKVTNALLGLQRKNLISGCYNSQKAIVQVDKDRVNRISPGSIE